MKARSQTDTAEERADFAGANGDARARNSNAEVASARAAVGGPTRMLRLKQVIERVELGKTTIYKEQNQGRFPHSVQLTNHSVRWIEAEIEEYLASRALARAPHNNAKS